MTTDGPNSVAAYRRQFDDLSAADAVVVAWVAEGTDGQYRRACRLEVRRLLPLLARALDRMVAEHEKAGLATAERALDWAEFPTLRGG